MNAKKYTNPVKLTNIKVETFGEIDSEKVLLFTLHNSNGISAKITNYGGIITSLTVPDKRGVAENIILGYNTLNEYLNDTSYHGALIGRFCNRIAYGKFLLDDKEYQLATNNDPNHLHGGLKGFNKIIWDAKTIKGANFVGLELSLLSKDMEEGYPGNLTVKVSYKLTDENELKVDYFATTDKKTIINLTQHSYFNLSGNIKSTILDHHIKINADHYLPVNRNLIPKGNLEPVKNTPFDFSEFNKIGARINDENIQLKIATGYDHTFVLNKENPTLAAAAFEEESGRLMEVYTTKPGVQFYTGNFLSNPTESIYKNRNGFCLETQYFPNSPNQPNFPSTILLPKQQYKETTVFKFLLKT